MKHSLLLALLLGSAILVSCSDETTVEPEPAVDKAAVWRRLPIDIGAEENFVGLQVGEHDMMALATRYAALVDAGGKVLVQEFIAVPMQSQTRVFMNDSYVVYPNVTPRYRLGPTDIDVALRWGAGAFNTDRQIALGELDPTLSDRAYYYVDPSRSMHAAVVNSLGQMLVTVQDERANELITYTYLVQLANPAITPVVVWRREQEARRLLALNEHFYSPVVGVGTVEIYQDGSTTKVLDGLAYDMINYHGKMVASTDHGIFASSDNGVTWGRINGSASAAQLFEVDHQLCFHNGGVAVVDLSDGDPNGFSTQLANDGLPFARWWDAAQFGSRVYIATEEGLFYKPVSHFFTPLHTE